MNKVLQPRVALVHDYLKVYGGAERVLEALHKMFPQAPIFTAYYDPKSLGPHAQKFKDWDIHTSWIQNIPWAGRFLSPLKILAPAAFESFDLSPYNVVISSTNDYFAKAVITPSKAVHISYIHTPPQSLYSHKSAADYGKHWWTKIIREIMVHLLRLYDFHISQRPDILIANSQNVAKRINKFYRRDAVVIYPPIDVEKYRVSSREYVGKGKDYYLTVGRLVRGKGIEVVIEVCTRLGMPLKVVGTGPLLAHLKKVAGKKVEFLGQVSDESLPALLTQAKAVIVASEDEDFGIVPVEAQACGTAVIARRAGGYLETVVEGKTGEFFQGNNLAEVLSKFNPKKYKAEDYRSQAENFSKERFKKEILNLIKQNLKT